MFRLIVARIVARLFCLWGVSAWLTMIAVLLLSAPAAAYTGKELLALCHEHGPGADMGACLGYIAGVTQQAEWNNPERGQFCKPHGVTYGQTMNMILRALEAHPERLQVRAVDLIIDEMKRAFPCTEVAAEIAPGEDPAPSGYWPIVAIDGVTVRSDTSGNNVTVRLIGFDAPEIDGAKCPAELALAKKAKARLEAIIKSGKLKLTVKNCPCKPEARGTKDCNDGRECGALTANDIDVGKILIGEGLARPYQCGATSCPRREPWCQEGRR